VQRDVEWTLNLVGFMHSLAASLVADAKEAT
jgi:hypothetical protein